MPKISMFCLIAVSAPEEAKAMVPIISIIKIMWSVLSRKISMLTPCIVCGSLLRAAVVLGKSICFIIGGKILFGLDIIIFFMETGCNIPERKMAA